MTTNKVKCGQGKCPFTDEFCASGDCPYDHDVLKKQKKINISEGNVKEDDINVAQRNSQDLTAQWKKGKIKKAKYWVKYRNGNIDIWELSEGITIESKPEIIEVLAPVLSFEECNKLQNSLEHEKMRATHYYKTLTEIEDENEKLEELLKECKQRFETYKRVKPCGEYMIYDLEYLTSKIDEVLR